MLGLLGLLANDILSTEEPLCGKGGLRATLAPSPAAGFKGTLAMEATEHPDVGRLKGLLRWLVWGVNETSP